MSSAAFLLRNARSASRAGRASTPKKRAARGAALKGKFYSNQRSGTAASPIIKLPLGVKIDGIANIFGAIPPLHLWMRYIKAPVHLNGIVTNEGSFSNRLHILRQGTIYLTCRNCQSKSHFSHRLLKHILLSGGTKLAGVIDERASAGVLTDLLEGRNRHRGQKADDDDDYHDFDKGETLRLTSFHVIMELVIQWILFYGNSPPFHRQTTCK